MSFLKPKEPRPVPVVQQPIMPASDEVDEERNFASLISTGPSGLKRKASTQKTSLIGGSS